MTDSRGCVVRNSNTNFGAAFIIPYKQLRNPELVFSTDNACLVDDFCFDAIPNIEIDNTILTSQSSILIKPYCDGSFYPLSIQNSPYNDVAFIPQPDRITRTNNHYCVGYNSIGTKYITYDGFSNDSYFHPCNSFSNTYEITVNYHDETDAQDIVYGQLSGNRNQTSLEIFSPYPPTTCTLSTPSCYTFLIDASSVVDFTARDQIVLFPGFEIEEGGNLIAKINPCLVDNNSIQIHSENGNYPYSSNQSTLKIHQKDEEMNFSKFEVYPNPTNNIININITIDKEYKNELFLTNNLGELLKVFVLSNAEEIEVQINLIGLDVKPGIYFLTLRTPKLVSTKKIVYIN